MVELTESRIQSEIYIHHHNTYPDQRGLLFMVHNSPRNAQDGARLRAMGMVAGVSDLLFLAPDGQVFAIEVKTDTGRQQSEQLKWQQTVESIGVRYVIVRSVDDFEQLVMKRISIKE